MTLRVERPIPGVLAIRLDRPESRNAIDLTLVEALLDAFGAVAERAVVLGSTDPACFCAGADVRIGDDERARVSVRLYELYGRMLRLDIPIVAAVSGHAVGGGAQLAIASDLRIGSASTRFRFAGAGHGLAVGAWGLPSLVGRGRALDLCLTLRPVEANEALQIGLLDRIVDEPSGAFATAVEMAGTIADLEPGAVGRVKSIVRDSGSLLALLERERDGNRTWSGSVAGLRGEPERPAP